MNTKPKKWDGSYTKAEAEGAKALAAKIEKMMRAVYIMYINQEQNPVTRELAVRLLDEFEVRGKSE